VLEGVGGERGDLRRGLGEVGGKVDGVVVAVEADQGGEVGEGLRRQAGGPLRTGRELGREGGMRGQLGEEADAVVGGEVGDALVEVDGLADVLGPVGGVVVLVAGGGLSGDVGDDGDVGVAEGVAVEEVCQVGGEGVEDGLGVCAVWKACATFSALVRIAASVSSAASSWSGWCGPATARDVAELYAAMATSS